MDAQVPNETRTATCRLFIALPVPEEVKREIQRAQDQLRRELPEGWVRWNRAEQLHLTLRFLGNVDVAQTAALTDAVRAACANFAPLKLRAGRIGCFPDLRFPRVVWVGVHDGEKRLADLAKSVGEATAAFSEETREEKFTGHITIALIKNVGRREAGILAKLAQNMTGREFGEWTADAIEIVRSELAVDGARPTCLARLPLRGMIGQ
ncbi:MAG: RNA 2',3'-cyclic phosphodiesterase [Verrucomicrobiota bacterium]